MKLNSAGLKYLFSKQGLIDHGEKLVLGLVALVALLVIVGAPWARETRTPEEMARKADESQQKVRSSTWPDDEKAKYASQKDIRERVNELLMPVAVARYDLSTPTIWPLYRRQEPIREPKFLAVEDFEARVDRPILEITDRAKASAVDVAAADKQPENNGRDATAPRDPSAPRGVRPGLGGANTPMPDVDPGVTSGGYAGTSSATRGKGNRCAVLVGVVPLRKQLEQVAGARHESLGRVTDLVQYLDFELQRQKAVAGPNPWPEDEDSWEPVRIQVALETLAEASDFDDDVVDGAVTDPVLTMPLPKRVAGYWDVGHSRLKDYELSEEGKEQARLINEQLAKLDEMVRAQQEKQGPVKGGFATQVRDIRGIRSAIAGNAENLREFEAGINTSLGTDINNRGLTERLKAKVTAAGQLLLFRYLDFDVAPNAAYRYRVRLVLANPNFGLSPDQVVAPHVAEGQTRTTPWSQPTNPIVVGDDVNFFLTQVEAPRGVRTHPVAQFDIYQWNPETGVPVFGDKLKAIFGQVIGGLQKAPIMAPPVSVTRDVEFPFKTGDVLVDATEGQQLDDKELSTIHKDLGLPSDMKGRLGLVDKALIATETGELETMDPITQTSREARQKRLYDGYIENWLKAGLLRDPQAEAETRSRLDDLTSQAGYDPMNDPDKKKGRRRSNATRKQSAAAP